MKKIVTYISFGLILVNSFMSHAHAAGAAVCFPNEKNKSKFPTDLPFSDEMFLYSDLGEISGYTVEKEVRKRMKEVYPEHQNPSCKSSGGSMEYGYFVVAKSDFVKDSKGNGINKLGFGAGTDRKSAILAVEKHLKSKD